MNKKLSETKKRVLIAKSEKAMAYLVELGYKMSSYGVGQDMHLQSAQRELQSVMDNIERQ